MTTIKVISFLCILALVRSLPDQEDSDSKKVIRTENELLDSVYKECLQKDSISCVKYKVYSEVDKVLDNQETITVTEGVKIIKTGEAPGAPRSFSGDSIESALLSKAKNFIESRSVQFDLSGKNIITAISNTARSIQDYITEEEDSEDGEESEFEEESRGKKKKGGKKFKKLFGGILGIVLLKKALIVKLLILGVALLAGKALIVSKLALVLSLIIWLKKLLSKFQGGGHHEVIAAPIHTVSHVNHASIADHHGGGYGGDIGGGYGGEGIGHGHSAWARNAEAQNLAYKAYKAAPESQS